MIHQVEAEEAAVRIPLMPQGVEHHKRAFFGNSQNK